MNITPSGGGTSPDGAQMTAHREVNLYLALLCFDELECVRTIITTSSSLALNFGCLHAARADVRRFHRYYMIQLLERTVSFIDHDKVAYKTRIR